MRLSGTGRPSVGSMAPSERPSASMYEDYVRRVRNRLRCSGAITSSRSALSHGDAGSGLDDDYVVDVGEGKRPNFTEQLLARLEQHGLRRCNADEDDFTEFTASPEVIHEEAQAERDIAENNLDPKVFGLSAPGDTRREYFYICVPCEMRLTKVSTFASTHKMLEDVHYHFSSAAHRSTASWMADPDIDVTLTNLPLVDVAGYTRIFVNGVPMLLPRRPGGGDMFYALPHEQEWLNPNNKIVRRAPPPHHTLDSTANAKEEAKGTNHKPTAASLYPSLRYSSDANYWYRPLTSTYCHQTRQIVSRFEGSIEHAPHKTRTAFQQSIARRRIRVNHMPLQGGTPNPLVDSSVIPTIPALYPILRRRIAKKVLMRAESSAHPTSTPVEGCRVQYIQPYRPYLDSFDIAEDAHARTGEIASLDRFIVEAEGVYRIGLLSEKERNHLEHERDLLDTEEAALGPASLSMGGQSTEFVNTAPLTQEMLSQLTQGTSFASKRLENHKKSSMCSYGSASFAQSSPPQSRADESFASASSQN
ncbi:unnamed protein product [Phytomonas sp. EM1]|nr:unnamed protein product [Phytomonas sp. EM1]|eukprot:CCW60989.1 unnamed protein product [Phytomonas sp. isolate EM1]